VVLLLLAVGVGLHLILRRSHPGAPVEERAASRIAEPQPAPRLAPAARPPEPRLAAGGQVPAPADAAAQLPRTEVEMLRQRQWLLATHFGPALQEADERAFARLGISEDKRAAIRLLNERLTRREQSVLAALRNDPAQKPRTGGKPAVTDAPLDRRAELEKILGLATAASFQSFERAEIRRLQRRYIAPWDAEMEKLTFPPPTPPPGAH
jgi:hypothetical protein